MADLSMRFDADAARKVEQIYLTPDVVVQRARVLELLQLRPDEQVADLGCGPGLLAESMARQVGQGGSVRCIDSSAPMLSLARRRCAALPWVTVDEGDVASLNFPDASVDVVVCTQVYEYVADIERALNELRRVLKPDGRALIVDTDWESAVWANGDARRMARVLDAWDKHCAHPQLPRTLSGKLHQAGLQLERVEVVAIVNPQLDVDTYSHNMIEVIAAYAASRGGIEREEARAWAEDLNSRAGDYFFSLNRYVFLARHRES
jgi:arsenite methyltransferase